MPDLATLLAWERAHYCDYIDAIDALQAVAKMWQRDVKRLRSYAV